MTAPVAAGIYCRISLASTGDTTKTDDQERICRELAERKGWHVYDVYTDHARSAWQPNRKRPRWEKMLADVEAGHISAIVVYHGDRLLRTHEDLLKLINLARTRGIQLASPAGTRDLGSPDDQFILEIEASMAKRESANTSRRRKAQYERWRRAGRVRAGGRGGRAFAFETDGLTHVPAEAELVRKATQMVLSGSRASEIVRWLNDQGVVTPAGNEFRLGTLRKMLMRPRYAGLMPDGVSKAAWLPVVDRADWEAMCAVLDARAAGIAPTSSARTHLLSGIARCGMCDGPMQVGGRAGNHGYRCAAHGHLFRSQPLLDAYVSRATWLRVIHPATPAGRAPESPGLAGEFAALTTARAEVEAAIADPALGGRLPLLLARLDSIDKRLAELRALAGDDARHRLLAAHARVTWEEFCALPLQVRRSLVAACFEVTVLPASKRGPGFRTEDVQLVPR